MTEAASALPPDEAATPRRGGASASAGAVVEARAVDGRVARRDRNRAAVLEALVELFSEGEVDPTPEAVAQRVGLSPRSVYRYFDDRDALLRAGIEHHLGQVWHHYLIHAIGEGPLDDRIDRFVAARLRLYEAIAATARVSRLRAMTNEIIREQVELTRRALREQVERHFAPEFDAMTPKRRRARVAAIDALFELESVDHYRLHRGFAASDTRALLTDALEALLQP